MTSPRPNARDSERIRLPGGPGSRRRAFLVGVALPGLPVFEAEEHLAELAALADTAGVEVVGETVQARKSLDPKFFIGSGKATEVAAKAAELQANLVIFDDDLSGGQVKNLEEVLKVQVMDRSGLILEIFDQRARSKEARTQVELARLQYLLPRLTRQWQHLSRQVGGIGVRGGEGESQLEADRRVIKRNITRLKRELEQIDRMRKEHRRGRSEVPVVALAGYTNAGKSTLFNRLTNDKTFAENRLFATLDSRLRRGALDREGALAVFADTVGFIRKLPHHLVASFRSTLDEIVQSDLVLHVIDRSHPRWEEQKAVAEDVMKELGIDPANILEVHNKIDRLPAEERISRARAGVIAVDAETGEGIEALQAKIARALGDKAHARPSGRASAAYWENVAAQQTSELAEPADADVPNAAAPVAAPAAAAPATSAPRSGPSRIGGEPAGAPRSRKRTR
ncbi:MAG: GTPase HflX [Thermoanaerobaculia bacterium]